MSQRLAYMQQLGVDVYVPRKVLPKAKASLTSLQPVVRATVPAARSTPVDTPAPAIPKTPVPRPELSATPVARKTPAVAPPIPKTVPAAAAATRFQLLHVPFSSGILFISELRTAPLPPALEASVLQFLQAVVFALGRGSAQTPEVAYFQWPLVNKPGANHSAATARDVLSGFIARQLRETAPQHLVLCGEQASRFVQPEGDVLAGTQVSIWRTHALGKVFADASVKAQMWQVLQPLLKQ
jgi:hypothetical protein